jgi:hypothetical protein
LVDTDARNKTLLAVLQRDGGVNLSHATVDNLTAVHLAHEDVLVERYRSWARCESSQRA